MKIYESEKILNKIGNVIGISEFQPIVRMCEEWLSERDETKFEKSNKELLEIYMNTLWLPMGWSETFTCLFVHRGDFMDNTDKAKCWLECATKYLKTQNNKIITTKYK